MIDSRLFEHYQIDINKDLGMSKRCPRPFDTLLINKQGSCYLCECTAWLPQSVGNIQTKSIEEILNSGIADALRVSIADGSYRYCNEKQCSYLLDARDAAPWPLTLPTQQIRQVRLAIDDSCNLSCPSCRVKKIFLSSGRSLKIRMDMADTILEYLQSQSHPIHVHIGSDGDPFASLVYRHFMRRAENMSHLSFSIQTNGLLIKQMHHRIKNIFSRLQTLNVSIDGATKHTYELLRQGGSYAKILDNLACIKEIKKQYGFEFILHVVVQKDNYHEMAQMVDLAEQYGADRIWFNRITNWNTHANFAELDVADENNADHPQYLEMLSKIKHRAASYDQRFIEMPTLVSKTFK